MGDTVRPGTARPGRADNRDPITGSHCNRYDRSMVSLILMVKRLVDAVVTSWRDRVSRGAAISLVGTVTGATIFYTLTEKWSVLDALFYAVSVGLPMGNGALGPTTTVSKIFTLIYALVVVGLFVAVGGSLAKATVKNTNRKVARVRRDDAHLEQEEMRLQKKEELLQEQADRVRREAARLGMALEEDL
ncbi:hypothetical protein DVB88_11780 [Tsukamurella pulmonis]|nr:hypothetical protein DVB88_11780 [Tsukamurella pulmonis]